MHNSTCFSGIAVSGHSGRLSENTVRCTLLGTKVDRYPPLAFVIFFLGPGGKINPKEKMESRLHFGH